MKILIAEDDLQMCRILKMYLEKEGYTVDQVHDGEAVLGYFETNHADLLLLDWMMPKKSGLDTLKELRQLQLPLKIIMLTAKATWENELQGLTVGADDYIKKPFDIKVLFIRIKKLCGLETPLTYRELSLNPITHQVKLEQKNLTLTRKEFDLLKYFLSNQNVVLSREKILDYVWGLDYQGDTRTVDTHVRRLRKKLGDSYIQTLFGTGYLMGDLYE